MSAFQISGIVWGSLFLVFVVLEFLAIFDKVPWNTLSWTTWRAQELWGGFSVLLLGGLVVLTVHIVKFAAMSAAPKATKKRGGE